MYGKDAIPRKRRAEDDPDDPRSGVWQNTGDVEDEDDVADLFGDFDHDAPEAMDEASGSGVKRSADDEADDRGRGDVDIVLPFECDHCMQRFGSRNRMFNHLYHVHDDDGKCAAKRRWMIPTDPGRRPGRPEVRGDGMRRASASTRS